MNDNENLVNCNNCVYWFEIGNLRGECRYNCAKNIIKSINNKINNGVIIKQTYEYITTFPITKSDMGCGKGNSK